jgi:hypothetical protein
MVAMREIRPPTSSSHVMSGIGDHQIDAPLGNRRREFGERQRHDAELPWGQLGCQVVGMRLPFPACLIDTPVGQDANPQWGVGGCPGSRGIRLGSSRKNAKTRHHQHQQQSAKYVQDHANHGSMLPQRYA